MKGEPYASGFLRRQSVSYANGATALFAYSARGDIRCHDINLSGAAASACNGAGAEVAYDFTSNGVGQILSETLASTLSGEDLVWRPSVSANDNYAVNGLNQYTSVTGAALGYDGNGNLTSDGRGRSFTFDAENVLRTATVSGTGTTDYRYYADGTRAEKIAPGNLTSQFYYMGGLGYLDAGDTEFAANQEIAEYDGATLLRRYVRLPGSVDEAFLMIDQSLPAGDRERWAHPNRQGSTIVISDSAGAVVDAHTYSPFGQAGEGDGGFPFRFTGQKLDPETGLYYYKARYYDPELGRFLQTDPIGYADQMNLYAYVGNDPINATDPTGEFGLVGAGIGAVSGGGFEAGRQLLVHGEITDGGAILRSAAVGGLTGLTGGLAGAGVRVAVTGLRGSGAILSTTAGRATQGAIMGASGGAAGETLNQVMVAGGDLSQVDAGAIRDAALIGAVAGSVGGTAGAQVERRLQAAGFRSPTAADLVGNASGVAGGTSSPAVASGIANIAQSAATGGLRSAGGIAMDASRSGEDIDDELDSK